jgi:putative CocE/NonD family hydrolase
MQFVDPSDHGVEVLENVWIPLPDGQRLAARIWLPEGARDRPVPAIFEYLPYRKRDLTRLRDDLTHGWFSSHGYACVRVDMRGSGESEGILRDQYREQELADGEAAIAWIAEQPWCSGAVGMMGISWGGFNALQVAARRPPALKAVVSVCSTDDLYTDNMHYKGGCLLTDNLVEATTMLSVNTSPPDPQLVGDSWREMWHERLRESGLWIDTWLRHQRRDEYWHHGSVCEDYGAIECPVLVVGGWFDGFRNSIFRLLRHLEVPRWAIVGPWAHCYPHYGVPGPAIGFLQECDRFWGAFLEDGREPYEAPRLRAWIMDSLPPATRHRVRPGRWVAEESWPSSNVDFQPWRIAPARLFKPGKEIRRKRRAQTIQSPLSLGQVAGKWLSSAVGPDLAHDQREEDGGALTFDSLPLKEPIDLLGAPELELDIAADAPVAMLCVRLIDVAPDDKATRLTYGLLNLTHRSSSASPEPLVPGERYRVRLQLNYIGTQIPEGHRIRLSLSSSYWPIAWPSPTPARLTIHTDDARLHLPVRAARPEDDAVSFDEPAGATMAHKIQVEPSRHDWLITRSLGEYLTVQEVIADEGLYRLDDIDMTLAEQMVSRFSHEYDEYESVAGETTTERRFERGDWKVRTTTRTVLTSTATHFRVRAEVDAYENGVRVFSENYSSEIERDLV